MLSNPGADLAKYAELFKLNERELELFAALIPKRQFLLKTPTRSGVLNVELDPAAYWTYTTSPEDKARRARCDRATRHRRRHTNSRRNGGEIRSNNTVNQLLKLSALSFVLGVSFSSRLIRLEPRRDVKYKTNRYRSDGDPDPLHHFDRIARSGNDPRSHMRRQRNWAVNWTGNLAYIKPAIAKALTNINLVTQAGHVYSFIATEVTGTSTPADLKIFVTPTDNSALVTLRDKPRFVPVADVERERKRADAAEAKLSGTSADAPKEIAKERIEALAVVTAAVVHDYKFKLEWRSRAVQRFGHLSR